MTRVRLSILFFALLVGVSLCFAQATKNKRHVGGAKHIVVTPDQVKWGPGPPSLPAGAEMAVLRGDPSKAGTPFTIRAKMPDGYRVPPHWHPTDENVSVVQGTLVVGMGTKFDESAGSEMPAGSYALMPKGVRHFAWAKGDTIIDIYGVGPFAINYVNPGDDPRHKAK
jgi:quercetin dioxygenase-like cupin family protein